MNKLSYSISLIGSGNVATQLGLALKNSHHTILQVYSKTKKSATILADLLNAKATDDLKKISPEADIYIMAIKDDAIVKAVKRLNIKDKIIVHTSGSIDMTILKRSSKNHGVFYPLQTFSKNRKIDFSTIPICIEASNLNTLKTLNILANSISKNVQKINSEERKALHLAAVFACNFTNHLYVIAENILVKNKLSFDILKPLIKETANKIERDSPAKMQTGPAKRGDKKIMNEHLKLLSNKKEVQRLYKLLSQSIIISDVQNLSRFKSASTRAKDL